MTNLRGPKQTLRVELTPELRAQLKDEIERFDRNFTNGGQR